MANEEIWKKAAANKEDSLAYIHKNTKENPEFTELANAALVTAKALMKDLKEQNLLTQSYNPDGEQKPDKMVVKVTEGKDGKVYAQGTIKHGADALTVNFSPRIEDGAVRATSMSASKFVQNKDGTGKSTNFKADEIGSANIFVGLKAIASHFAEQGIVQSKEYAKDDLFPMYQAINTYLSLDGVTGRVQSVTDANKAVKDTYATFSDSPRCIEVRSHTDKNIVVELGYSKDGNRFAVAKNFDMDKNGNPNPNHSQAPMSVFINTGETLDELPLLKEIKDIVAGYKGFDEEMTNKLEQFKDDALSDKKKVKNKDKGEER